MAFQQLIIAKLIWYGMLFVIDLFDEITHLNVCVE